MEIGWREYLSKTILPLTARSSLCVKQLLITSKISPNLASLKPHQQKSWSIALSGVLQQTINFPGFLTNWHKEAALQIKKLHYKLR